MDTHKIDLVLKYILAAAGQEDPDNQEVGPIHLIKYAFLGDLAFAEVNAGRTFTGCKWQFYHYGPWCLEAYKRIEPVVAETHPDEKRISSPKYESDFVRWKLNDDHLFEDLDRDLPFELTRAIRMAIHEFGSDTSSLLHYVYNTEPMLRAAPGEILHLNCKVAAGEGRGQDEAAVASEAKAISDREKRKRKEKLAAFKEKIRTRLKEESEKATTSFPDPAPRYDDVYFEGQKWLDELAGEPVEACSGELTISNALWKSRARGEKEIS